MLLDCADNVQTAQRACINMFQPRCDTRLMEGMFTWSHFDPVQWLPNSKANGALCRVEILPMADNVFISTRLEAIYNGLWCHSLLDEWFKSAHDQSMVPFCNKNTHYPGHAAEETVHDSLNE